jgi:hypothetical protein
MTDNFEFQFPWLLGLLALLPVYALLRGKAGKLSALKFSSAEIARASGTRARAAAGRFFIFLTAARCCAGCHRLGRAAAGGLSRRDRESWH